MNQREDTTVINYLKAENAYTDAMMKHTDEFQKDLFEEMVARIKKTDINPLLLKVNMEYGHGGASGRFQRYHEYALEYAFVLDLADIHS